MVHVVGVRHTINTLEEVCTFLHSIIDRGARVGIESSPMQLGLFQRLQRTRGGEALFASAMARLPLLDSSTGLFWYGVVEYLQHDTIVPLDTDARALYPRHTNTGTLLDADPGYSIDGNPASLAWSLVQGPLFDSMAASLITRERCDVAIVGSAHAQPIALRTGGTAHVLWPLDKRQLELQENLARMHRQYSALIDELV